jgi:hypothetical protein
MLEGAQKIEIKATIPQSQVQPALRRYGLTERNDDERYIYFFDTPDLKLLESGIIACAEGAAASVSLAPEPRYSLPRDGARRAAQPGGTSHARPKYDVGLPSS